MQKILKIGLLLLALAPAARAQKAYERFEQLWSEVSLNYPYFEIKGVDWDAVKMRYAPKFKKRLSRKKEAQLLAQVLAELRDMHVGLQTSFGVFRYKKQEPDVPDGDFGVYFPKEVFDHGTAQLRVSADGIVWLHVRNLDQEIIPSDTIWDQIFASKGLIINLSGNGGGNEKYARHFVEKLITDTLVYKSYRFTSGKARNDFNRWETGRLVPAAAAAYSRPIVAITNSTCYSSCEAFALMLKSVPNCQVIGEPTGGSSGFPKKFTLDNGWTYTISTWQEGDPERHLIEDHGVAPDIRVPPQALYPTALEIIRGH